ncbi:MAG: glycosyltransferase [Actinomycetota bacterium]|nr:glycosyltransferase [Actinomycetota bacterium]
MPELWAKGLQHATGDLVGLLASTAVPDPDWVARTLELHRHGEAAVGGAIEPGTGLRLVDWAVYFCRYTPYLLPIDEGSLVELPGDNASYRTDILARYRHLWERGFWEPAVHHAMRADGHHLRMSGERVVRHGPGTRAGAFCRQRFNHGRAHGERRWAGRGRAEVVRTVVTAPLVPPLLTMRAARAVFARRRLRARFVVASPFVLWFYCWWAAGELSGRLRAARSERPA